MTQDELTEKILSKLSPANPRDWTYHHCQREGDVHFRPRSRRVNVEIVLDKLPSVSGESPLASKDIRVAVGGISVNEAIVGERNLDKIFSAALRMVDAVVRAELTEKMERMGAALE